MSKYMEITVSFKNRSSLIKALQNLQVPYEVSEGNSLSLYGFQGDKRPEQAALVIRRKELNKYSGGASNDLGFAWNGKEFTLIVSEYDNHRPGVQSLLRQIKQEYAVEETSRLAKAKGYKVTRQKEGDQVKLVLTKI